MNLIMTPSDLKVFLDSLKEETFVAVDTEFMRETTYWPQVCLIQIAGQEKSALIDPLADGMDLSPLFNFMKEERPLKVFHAARQDLEIFYNLTGEVPKGVFDTQIAGMVCGFGDSVGYEALVRSYLGKSLDKSAQYTNWAKRPLSEKQLTYALKDVIYLREIFQQMSERLEKEGRLLWIEEEIKNLLDESLYRPDPENAWRRIRLKGGTPRYLARLKVLAEWREKKALKENRARSRILKDDLLSEIAYQNPQSLEDLSHIRQLPDRYRKKEGAEELFHLLSQANALPDGACPVLEKPKPGESVNPGISDLLRVLLRLKADQLRVAEKLIATSKDLDALAARREEAEVKCLQGWRHEVFGKEALSFLRGESRFRILDKKLILEQEESSPAAHS